MQVKKFEAPTIQEALDTIKRELGPEAIILQTKKNKRGFGLMSKASVEVTAAVSERALSRKTVTEKKLPEVARQAIARMPAGRQAEIYGKTAEPKTGYGRNARTESDAGADEGLHLGQAARQTKDRVELGRSQVRPGTGGALAAGTPRMVQQQAHRASLAASLTATLAQSTRAEQQEQVQPSAAPLTPAEELFTKPITTRRYIDIEDEGLPGQLADKTVGAPVGNLSLEQQVENLKQMLEEMHREKERGGGAGAQALLANPTMTELTPALQDAFEQLVVSGIDKRYAFNLVRKVKFELGDAEASEADLVQDRLASEILETIEVLSPTESLVANKGEPTLIALVGPTGVGKTTTVAKVASHLAREKGLRVGLVNLDAYKVAAFDQLATYAKILKVPFRSASTQEDFQAAVADFAGLDVVLIDTTGRSHRDPEGLKAMESLISSIPNIQVHLVLSSTTRDQELYEMASRFAAFHPQGLIMSKLDEATTHGALYNVSLKTRLPLLYFATGQRVPEDIEEATRERLCSLLMDL